MQRWRLAILAALFATPVLILAGLGALYLWWSGWSFWVWWALTGCLALGYILAWRWQSRQQLLRLDSTPPLHWTERDRQAWKLVEERAKRAARYSNEQLTSPAFYLETGEEMAIELAGFYHPGAQDPVGALTIPEILAVMELASRDLSEMVDQFLPGGHLLSINDFRRIKRMADWYPTLSNITWLISGLFSPFNTAVRYVASQAGVSVPWQRLQANLLVWFFTAFLHRLGRYLIDLNSGRLRVGAMRYRELLQHGAPPTEADAILAVKDPDDAVRSVRIAVIGQAKAGKSSVINALLGEQRAITDVLPATNEIQRYELQPAGVPSRFHLFDTVGYGAGHVTPDQRRAIEHAARDSDLILLVLHARNPARQSDHDVLVELHRYFEVHVELRQPPVLGVLTHIDLLSPSLEWNPPYDWQEPRGAKEQHIHGAVSAALEQLGPLVGGIVPVCTAEGRVYGVNEWLLPALVGLLDQAHAVALLRCLRAEANAGKIRRVFHQLAAVGKGLVQTLWQTSPVQSR